MKAKTTKRLAFAGLALAAAGVATFQGASGPASADPLQYSNPVIGVGSDTVQDVMDAFAGYVPLATTANPSATGKLFTPLVANNQQIISYDAIAPFGGSGFCITPKVGAPLLTRPNGSGEGVAALSAAIRHVGWGADAGSGLTSGSCKAGATITGQVNFARASGVQTATGGTNELTYIPFGRDAVSWAYYSPASTVPDALTAAQLTQIYSTTAGPDGVVGQETFSGKVYVACALQGGSGTWKFFTGTALSVGDTHSSTTKCLTESGTVGDPHGPLEENDGTALKTRATTAAAVVGGPGNSAVYVVPFSAASWIAKNNGFAATAPPAGVGIGSISDDLAAGGGANLGSPISGTAPTLTPNSAFYASTKFGRLVYTVVSTTDIGPDGDPAINGLFVGTSSKVCQATSTINSYGFQSIAGTCGDTSLTTGYRIAAPAK